MTEETQDATEQSAENNAQQANGRDFEAEAAEMGWVPKDQFRGDPERWTDAKSFVEKGETFIPFLKASNRKLEEQLEAERNARANDRAEFDKRVKRLENVTENSRKQQKEAYDRELKRIKAGQAKAVEDGDTATFRALESERDALDASKLATDVPDEPKQDDAATVQAFVAKNPWYTNNYEMASEAQNYCGFLAAQGVPIKDQLERTEAHIREKFPEHFGEKKKEKKVTKGTAGDGPDFGAATAGKASKGYEELPPEAKEMFKADAAEGLFKDDADGRKKWATQYWSMS